VRIRLEELARSHPGPFPKSLTLAREKHQSHATVLAEHICCQDGDKMTIDFSGMRCQLRRSMQHLHEVYSRESENLKSV
jgi:hypothetical protein